MDDSLFWCLAHIKGFMVTDDFHGVIRNGKHKSKMPITDDPRIVWMEFKQAIKDVTCPQCRGYRTYLKYEADEEDLKVVWPHPESEKAFIEYKVSEVECDMCKGLGYKLRLP